MQYVYDNYDEILYTFNDGDTHQIRAVVEKHTALKTDFYFDKARFQITNSSSEMMKYLITKLAAANEVNSAYALESMRNISKAISELLSAVEEFIIDNGKDINL